MDVRIILMKTKNDRYHKGNLRRTLLDAATQLLEEKGSSEFSLREVARVAGVSHTAPYRHFKDKAALARGIAQQGFDDLHATIQAAQESGDDIEQQLITAGVNYVIEVVNSPERARLMFSGLEIDPDDQAYIESCCAAYNDLRSIILAGIEQKIFNGDLDSITLAAWSAVHGMAMLYSSGVELGVSSIEELKERARVLTHQVINGFK